MLILEIVSKLGEIKLDQNENESGLVELGIKLIVVDRLLPLQHTDVDWSEADERKKNVQPNQAKIIVKLTIRTGCWKAMEM